MTLTIKLNRVSCRYDDERLFTEISTQIAPGSLVRIGGPNGAGKTTLLRCLAGLSSAFDGQISYTNESNQDLPLDEALTLMSYIGHRAGIKGDLSALDNLDWLTHYKYSEEELLAALDAVGLFGFEYQSANTLSAGQKRRVTLARLFLPCPAILILDEPFTALDIAAVAQLEHKLCELADRGVLVIFTTHHDIKLARVFTLMLESARAA